MSHRTVFLIFDNILIFYYNFQVMRQERRRRTMNRRSIGHIVILCVSILLFAALIPKETSYAAENMSLWQYSKTDLAQIVDICFISNESYGKMYYHLNTEALSVLPAESKGMFFAEMYNCYNGRVTSDDKDIAKYIEIFSEAYKDLFYGYKFNFLPVSEAGEFFKAFCDHMIPGKSQDKKDDLIVLINKYLISLETDYEYLDENLSDYYKQVLDTITVIDGKITSGSDKCILISRKKQSVKIRSKYEDHNVAVYLVTKPGTIKYTSIDKSTGKSKNYKKKYISLASAIDKELVKSLYNKQKNFLTIKKATVENAKKIHKLLLTGKEQVIKIPGSKEKAEKILSELENMVSEVNKGGYEFMYYEYPAATDSAVYIHITEYGAKIYNLCAEFYSRLEKQYKEKIKSRNDLDYRDVWYYAYNEYPDEQERLINLCYNQLVYTVLYDDTYSYDWSQIYGYDRMITSEGIGLGFGDIDFEDLNESFKLKYLSEELIIKSKTTNGTELYSLNEFRHLSDINEILSEYKETVGFMTNEELKAYVEKNTVNTIAINTLMHTLAEKPFYKLSDAEKLYAISLSGVFSCVYEHPDDGSLQMVYNLYADKELGRADLQHLLDGKAEGVCVNYANFECSIFDTLGFVSFKNRGYMHGGEHAWSVVKIVNNAGKEFWVPFDYGVIWSSTDETFKYYIELRADSYIDPKEIGEDPKYIQFTLKDFTE